MKIGIAFSGGGYRAAAFNLGAITYLQEVVVNGRPLLEQVYALSTISGGTITGLRYAIGRSRGESVETIYHALYDFMCTTDLVQLGLDHLSDPDRWQNGRIQSLINAVADIYDEELFLHSTFGELMTDPPALHLKHMSFNATEFANALQFRFQWSERIINPGKNQGERGLIGNGKYSMSEEVARQIRLADILAASSCFPGGFEPINFPTDFVMPQPVDRSGIKADKTPLPVGLMDGGIVDNQGIEPLVLADKRMEHNRRQIGDNDSDRSLDLIIVSDVASPYLDEYRASEQRPMNWWRKLTPKTILIVISLLLLASIVGLIAVACYGVLWATIVLTSFSTIFALVFLLGMKLKELPAIFHVPEHFLQPLGKLLRLRLIVYENLIMNRFASLLKLTNGVFLKQLRSLNYNKIWESNAWENRRIMNGIYELRPGEKTLEKKLANGQLPAYLAPTENLQIIAQQAAAMGTTLWFSPEELKANLIDVVIACGQFTLCWNLLEYIYEVKQNPVNTDESHLGLLAAESELLEHWQRFQKNPFWLTQQYKSGTTKKQNDPPVAF